MGAQRHVKILLVEDDPGVARLEQLELERAGYSVVTAATALRRRSSWSPPAESS